MVLAAGPVIATPRILRGPTHRSTKWPRRLLKRADRNGAAAPQPPEFQAAETTCPRVGQHYLIGPPGERLACQRLVRAPDPDDEYAEVDAGMTVHQLSRSGQVLSRQFAAHPVPQDGARVATTLRWALLGRESEDRYPPTLLARCKTQTSKRVVRTRARPIEDERVGGTVSGGHLADPKSPK
jgi:hypothetical protein